LTNSSVFQLSGNYLTSGSLISYVTSGSLTGFVNKTGPTIIAPLNVEGFSPNTQLRIVAGTNNTESSLSFYRTTDRSTLVDG
jgi:hypothetical protein